MDFQRENQVKSSQSNKPKTQKHLEEPHHLSERPFSRMEDGKRIKSGIYSSRDNKKILLNLRQMELSLKSNSNGNDFKKIRPQNFSVSLIGKETTRKTKEKSESTKILPSLSCWNSPLKIGRKNSPKNPVTKSKVFVNEDPSITSRKIESVQSTRNIKIKSLQIQSLANIYINPSKK